MKQNRLSLNDVEWGEFRITDYFKVKDGYYNKKPQRTFTNEFIPFLGATAFNNGITEFYDESVINQWDKVGNKTTIDHYKRYFDGDCIAIVNNGSVGKVYYQKHKFTCSHDITPVYGKNITITREMGLFLAKCFEMTGEGFSYSRKWRPKRIRKSKVFLPMNEKKEPNWQFMEDYIKQEQKVIAQKVISYYEQKMLETAFDLVGLEDVEWKNYSLEEIFQIVSVKGKTISKYEKGEIPYVSTSSQNNAVSGFVNSNKNLSKGNCISVDPIAGNCFYHQYDFVGRGGAGSAINLLYNINLDKYNSKFLLSSLEKVSKEKASYGIALNGQRLKTTKIILPTDKNGSPHWKYMSEFMKKIEFENLEKVLEYIYIYKLAICCESKIVSLNEKEWKEFWLEDIVDIKSGQDIYQRERITGNIPYITATAQNNGIGYFVDNHNKTLEEKAISVNRNGSVGYAFYHNYRALYGNDTRKLIPKYRNKYFSLFLTSVITEQKEKYGYGYKMGTGRLKRQKILLPINNLGDVDFDYIKKFMQIEEIKHYYNLIRYYKNY